MRFFSKKIFAVLVLYCNMASGQDFLTVDDAISSALKNNYDIETVRIDSSSYAIDNQYA